MIVQEVSASASASAAFASSVLARRDEHTSRILVTIHVADMLGTDVVEDSNCFRIFECPQRGKQQKRCLIDHVLCVAPVPASASATDNNNNNNNNNDNNNGSISSNTVSAQHWSDTVQELASSQWHHKRKLLVLINPVGGVGNSTTLYTQYVRPVFQRCTGTIDYAQSTIRTTTHPQHATEIVLASSFASKSLNTTTTANTPTNTPTTTTTTNNNNYDQDNTVVYDCIVVVGGDGFVSEVIQGLVALSASRHRSNSSSSSSSSSDEDDFDPLQIPIGIIPTGSGNGLANSLAAATPTTVHRSSCDPLSAAFAIAKGQPTGIDLASVRSAHHHVYAVLSIEWAFVANIDLESEHFRWLGSARFTMSAIKRIVWNSQQQWHGTFSYLPSQNDPDATTTTQDNKHIDTKDHPQPRHQQNRYLVDDLLPPLDIRVVPKTWISVCGEFGFFWAISTSMASNDTVVCPQAKYDDGYMYCVYTQHRLSICEKIGVLLSIEDGSYLTKYSNKFTVVQTRAFQLIPSSSSSKSKNTNITTNNSNNASHDTDNVMAIDGEVWKTTTTQVQVHRQLGTIMTL